MRISEVPHKNEQRLKHEEGIRMSASKQTNYTGKRNERGAIAITTGAAAAVVTAATAAATASAAATATTATATAATTTATTITTRRG